MTNIFQAIQIEEEYLGKNKVDSDAFKLKEKLSPQGFTLNEYHETKERHLFDSNKFKFATTTPETTHDDVSDAIKSNDSVVFVAAPTKTWMYGVPKTTISGLTLQGITIK